MELTTSNKVELHIKTCSKCRKVLPIEDYYNKHDSWCKYCRRKDNIKYTSTRRTREKQLEQLQLEKDSNRPYYEFKRETPEMATMQPKMVLVQKGDYLYWEKN